MSNGAYMVDEITIIKYNGVDVNNEPLATTRVPVKGKIEYKVTYIKDLTGEEVVSGGVGGMVSGAMIRLPETIDALLTRALVSEDKLEFDDAEHAILKIGRPKAFSSYFIFKYEVFVA